MTGDIKKILTTVILESLGSLALEYTGKITLEHPANLQFGDYSTNLALVLGQIYNRSPKDLAGEIVVQILKSNNAYLKHVEVAGPGFINFYLSEEFFKDQLKTILDQRDNFGRGEKKNQKILVEYSSPNIAKPFSIGHLRSTIIGDALANILAFSGYEIIRDNHLGDWGTQFGKQIVALKKWGDEQKIAGSDNPIKELVALYVKFHKEAEKNPKLEDEARAEFLKLEQGDPEAKKLWQKCIEWSLFEFNRIYQQLGINFDTTLGESVFVSEVDRVYQALAEKNLLQQSEGAELVFFAEDKLPPMIVRKKDGTSIYAVRDLAADLIRKEKYGDDIVIINEIGSEQELYLKQLYETEKMLGWFEAGQRIHVGHGLYRFPEGKMSTRKGNVIWLEDVLVEAIKRAKEFNPVTADLVGIGAIKYNDLKRDSKADILFDWEEVLNLKGNSGPYLQYTYARTQSILEKAGKEGISPAVKEVEEITVLEKLLYRFPEVVERSSLDYSAHHLATYLYELASAFSSYYVDHQVVSQEENSPYRVALTLAVGQVLFNGLNLLGIKTPAKM